MEGGGEGSASPERPNRKRRRPTATSCATEAHSSTAAQPATSQTLRLDRAIAAYSRRRLPIAAGIWGGGGGRLGKVPEDSGGGPWGAAILLASRGDYGARVCCSVTVSVWLLVGSLDFSLLWNLLSLCAWILFTVESVSCIL